AREKFWDKLRHRALEEAEQIHLMHADLVHEEMEKKEAKQPPKNLYGSNYHANRFRLMMMGKLDPEDVLPETPEDEAAMEALRGLPPGICQKERQRVARAAFRHMRQNIEKEQREQEENQKKERAKEFRFLEAVEKQAAVVREAEARKIQERDAQAIREEEARYRAACEQAQKERTKKTWTDTPSKPFDHDRFIHPFQEPKF